MASSAAGARCIDRPPPSRRTVNRVVFVRERRCEHACRRPHAGHEPTTERRPSPSGCAGYAPLAAIVAVAIAGGARWAGTANSRSRPWSAIAPRSTASSTAHGVGAVAAFVALYIAVVALSIPGALYPHDHRRHPVRRGRRRAVASVVGATIGATIIFLIAQERVRRVPDAARRPAGGEARRRLPRGRVQLPVVPAAGAVSVLPGQSGAGAGRRAARDLRRRDRDRHHSGDLRVRLSAPGSTA